MQLSARLRGAVFAVLFLVAPASSWASSITIRLSGELDIIRDRENPCVPPITFNCDPMLTELSVGMPWELVVTYDTDPDKVSVWGTTNFLYYGIEEARFRLGEFDYVFQGDGLNDFISVNVAFTDGVGVSGGLVQFHFFYDWLRAPGETGGPDLSDGLLIVSYYDDSAVNGDLPLTPRLSDTPRARTGLEWWYTRAGSFGEPSFFSVGLDVEAVEPPTAVPEPTSAALLGIGALALAAMRKRCRRGGR